MSSYITSPFVIEERRLMSIVSQCQQDLEDAISKVTEKSEQLAQQQALQVQSDMEFFNEEKRSSASYVQAIQKSQQIEDQRRAIIQKRMNAILSQLDVFSSKVGRMSKSIVKHQRINKLIDAGTIALEVIEREIDDLEQLMTAEVQEIASRTNVAKLSDANAITIRTRQRAGVSLKIEKQGPAQHATTVSITEEFEQRLDQAMTFKYSFRIPKLKQLYEKYRSTPQYARSGFAAKYDQLLCGILAQLKKIERSEVVQASERKNAQIKYQALCTLLGVVPEQLLLDDKCSIATITRTCNEMDKHFQEEKTRSYISHAVESIMHRYGISFVDGQKISNGNSMSFQLEYANIDVISTEQNRIEIQVSGDYEGASPTIDDRRKSVTSAQKFCALLSAIEADLASEFGVYLQDTIREEPDEATLKMRNRRNTRKLSRSKQSRKNLSDSIQ